MFITKKGYFFSSISFILFSQYTSALRTYTRSDLNKLRDEVKEMFYHAYESYLKYAYPYDELRPISCDGIDTYGSYSLTLIDALDTLAIMGNYTEFQRVVDILSTKTDFDANINVSVFETNIRIIGGLLSAHLLSLKAGAKLEPGFPCNGPLLRLAEDVAKRLIAAFDTKTGMPYGTVNLRHGVPKGETPVTCTAGIGTFIVEFGTLSRLTGDPLYEEVAMNALYSLFNHRSPLGLFGNHIDTNSGRWTAQDAGIGSGVDSYFEYLVKGSILLQKPELMKMFQEARKAIDKYMKKDDWYMWVSMTKGQVTLPVFQSLESFWPGLLSLIGETSNGMRSLHNYHQVWQQYGFIPEFYYIAQNEAGSGKESYPLRPELIESIMYLYRATGDPFLLEAGEDILRSINHSARTPCGYATIKDVRDHRKEDRMESFFLSETTKYLYLLFDTDNFIHNQGQHGTLVNTPNGECVMDAGGYIFNTEAHPIDPSALHCCHSVPEYNFFDFNEFERNKDLYRGVQIKNRINSIKPKPEERQDENTRVQEESENSGNKTAKLSENENDENLGEATVLVTYGDGNIIELNHTNLAVTEEDSANENANNATVGFSEKDGKILFTDVEGKVTEIKDNPTSLINIQEDSSCSEADSAKDEAPTADNSDKEPERKSFDSQQMLERFRRENKYPRNESWENSFELLSCRAQTFLQRLSIMAEFFN